LYIGRGASGKYRQPDNAPVKKEKSMEALSQIHPAYFSMSLSASSLFLPLHGSPLFTFPPHLVSEQEFLGRQNNRNDEA
jgi:hypothetical protein